MDVFEQIEEWLHHSHPPVEHAARAVQVNADAYNHPAGKDRIAVNYSGCDAESGQLEDTIHWLQKQQYICWRKFALTRAIGAPDFPDLSHCCVPPAVAAVVCEGGDAHHI